MYHVSALCIFSFYIQSTRCQVSNALEEWLDSTVALTKELAGVNLFEIGGRISTNDSFQSVNCSLSQKEVLKWCSSGNVQSLVIRTLVKDAGAVEILCRDGPDSLADFGRSSMAEAWLKNALKSSKTFSGSFSSKPS